LFTTQIGSRLKMTYHLSAHVKESHLNTWAWLDSLPIISFAGHLKISVLPHVSTVVFLDLDFLILNYFFYFWIVLMPYIKNKFKKILFLYIFKQKYIIKNNLSNTFKVFFFSQLERPSNPIGYGHCLHSLRNKLIDQKKSANQN